MIYYSEYEIIENMKEFLKGKTTIIIAHRLSTVKNADNIVVMDDGLIAEQETHEELLQNQSKYFNLVQKQLK